jgi:hypothetical protein
MQKTAVACERFVFSEADGIANGSRLLREPALFFDWRGGVGCFISLIVKRFTDWISLQ